MNFLIYNSIYELEEEINKIIMIILGVTFTEIDIINEKLNNIFNKDHWVKLNLSMDEIIDGCGFEIISLSALKKSHILGEKKHRSELCSLYIRENIKDFNIEKVFPPQALIRKDLRLTVDNPEDLVVCRAVYLHFNKYVPRVPLLEVVQFLDLHPNLKKLISPYAESGYATMNK